MSWFRRWLGGRGWSARDAKANRVDYLREALSLERQGDYEGALTSYQLALRDQPNDPRVLQNMAIAYSKTGRLEEAIRCYRRALDIKPQLSGAHYGLAFLLLKRGDAVSAQLHLDAFLAHPPHAAESDRWIEHARDTLRVLRGDDPTELPLRGHPGGDASSGPPADDMLPVAEP
jgi:tetratricopeptide (TPR) repeat protein